MGKTWAEQFYKAEEPVVAPSVRVISGFPIGTMMLLPSPSQVDSYLRTIPCGQERTVKQMGQDLAASAGAQLTCPFLCRTHLRVCAEKAYEDLQSGSDPVTITPFWRMIPSDSSVRKRLSFGVGFVDEMRGKEGLDR